MDNPNKVYLLYIKDKLESAWYNEENISGISRSLDNGYTEEEVYYKTCYIDDFNE